jgi:exodeoxyribonuclease VII large subunit
MESTQVERRIVYSPSAVVGTFGNMLNGEATKKPLAMKGIYVKRSGASYGGLYYDMLKDEGSDGYMTIVVPAQIRATLESDKTIEIIAFLTKRAQTQGGRIDLLINIIEVLSQQESKYSEEQLRGFELLQEKASLGYKDVDTLIGRKVTNGETITIIIITGKNGIIDTDIKHQLKEAIGYYKIHFLKINLSSEREIIEHLNVYSKKCDLLALARGGGDGLEVFNKPEIIETALTLQTPLITAIGHEQDVTLLQKVADKAFITPTALGQYLNDIYNKTIEQVQDTKAKLVNDISKQFKANYEHEIETLTKQVESLKELNKQTVENTIQVNQKEVGLLQSQVEELKQQHRLKVIEVEGLQKKVKSSASIVLMVLLIVVAIILGFALGKLL